MIYILGGILGLAALLAVLVLIARAIFNMKTPSKIIEANQSDPEAKSVFMKKFPEADVNRFHGTILQVGLVISLLMVIAAFSWTTYDYSPADMGTVEALDEFEIEPPQTFREPPPPPPPPPPIIEVVPDEEILEDEPEVQSAEITPETVIDIPLPPAPEPETAEEQIFTIVEDMPAFPGGDVALTKFLASIPYPAIARENDIEGTVFVRFIVDKTGKVTSVDVARGADRILNEAAVKHIQNMPRWAPGKQRGKPVKVQFVVPIKFRLG